MLLIKNYRYVFKYALAQLSDAEPLHRDTFEFSIPFYLLEVTLLLKFFWSPLIEQIGEHQLNLHEKLYLRRLSLFQVELYPEMANVI